MASLGDVWTVGNTFGVKQSRNVHTGKRAVRVGKVTLKGWAEDSDGESVRICQHCNLPMGDVVYRKEKGMYVHGECLAQLMVEDLRVDDKSRLKEDRSKKDNTHVEYGIGWNATAMVPRNDVAVSKLALHSVPQGMTCLMLDESTNSVRLAETQEPSAAINLEYLSIALQVRRTEGHEPIFSLEPVDAEDKKTMQRKVFVPDWLAGTSVGEVLFQADFHLKELSMGEFEQPVLGMKSCFDHTEMHHQYEWSAREWFLVRKAEIQVGKGNTLIPLVKMGVEAREQTINGNSLEDKPVTSKDHPMVRYAEEFTRNFDLIAERKSVFYHLRELAKASVMAKYLLDAGVQFEESWFNMANETEIPCSLEVPQLWNERIHSQLQVDNGTVGSHSNTRTHAVYGGVLFGLQKFNLAASVARQMGTEGQPRKIQTVSGGPPQPAALSTGTSRLSAALSAANLGPGASRSISAFGQVQLPTSGTTALQGVDLRLDQFNLSKTKNASFEAASGSWQGQLKQPTSMGSAFFASIDTAPNALKANDLTLLRNLYNPALSDRRQEGDLFVPPDASYSYVEKLRNLVKEEEALCQMRKEHFFSTEFVMEDPGPLFPHCWTPSLGVASGKVAISEGHAQGTFHICPMNKSLALQVLQNTSPIFDKSTEEGLRFRIYRQGSIEVRTSQALHGDEVIGVVFSIQNQTYHASAKEVLKGGDQLSKVTEYVEQDFAPNSDPSSLRARFFLALETEGGHTIIVERVDAGTFSWSEDPDDLHYRRSLAKVTRTKVVTSGVTVQGMKQFQEELSNGYNLSNKRFSQAMYYHAAGLQK